MGKYDASAALETQFKNDLFTRGFKTWNVQLSRSVNSMPPRSHQTGLRGKPPAGPISGVHPLTSSDFVLSSSKDDASVNVWATRAGLTHISALNFKLQAHIDPKESLSRAKLQHLSYSVREQDDGVKVYARGRSRAER
jgi:hypothetical protein